MGAFHREPEPDNQLFLGTTNTVVTAWKLAFNSHRLWSFQSCTALLHSKCNTGQHRLRASCRLPPPCPYKSSYQGSPCGTWLGRLLFVWCMRHIARDSLPCTPLFPEHPSIPLHCPRGSYNTWQWADLKPESRPLYGTLNVLRRSYCTRCAQYLESYLMNIMAL